MYTTKQVIKMLKNSNLGLIFRTQDEPNMKIFKTIHNSICISGNGSITAYKDDDESYLNTLWVTNPKSNRFRRVG